MFSAASPDSASMPDSTDVVAACRVAPWSYGSRLSSPIARSTPASTSQVSRESWSRTPLAASLRPHMLCAIEPSRQPSRSSERISGRTSTGPWTNPG